MAVSLKKREKVDLSKSDIPPKLREYTPVHLFDEEETIQRPRQPPTQPHNLTKSDRCLKDNEIEVKSDDKELEVERKRLKDLYLKNSPYFIVEFVLVVLTCLVVIVVLLVRTSSIDKVPVVSVPVESVSEEVVSAVIPVESVPAEDNSTSVSVAQAVNIFFEFFHNPIIITLFFISSFLFLASIVHKLMRW